MLDYQSIENQSTSYEMLKKARQGPTYGVVYRGMVVDNVDPSGTGRVKVWIPALYPSLNPQNNPEDKQIIPWALPCFSTASYNSGAFTIPQINDTVWILFENNDIFRPVYIGSMYTTGSSQAMPIGSSVAPARQNYVPDEGIRPDHYIITKTPKGSGLWMNDETGEAHFYSSKGGSVDLLEERATFGFDSGGSLNSEKDLIEIVSPLEGRIGITDCDEAENQTAYIRTPNAKILVIDGKKITIDLGDSEEASSSHKKIVLDEENNSIEIHYNEEVNIKLTEDAIKMVNGDSVIEMTSGELNLQASSVINIKAPRVNIEE